MPTVTETPVKGYAFCRNARCSGYQEEEVDALREETAYTYGDNGGDGVFVGMVERSMVTFRFADPERAPCRSCKQPREVSGSPRPSYQPLSGHNPMGLLEFGGFDPSMMVPPGGDRTAELEQKLAATQEQVQALIDAQAEKGKE